jgi:AAA+ ATPase superfamily predicted ATPase
LSDPHFRFYFRFLAPHLKSLSSVQQTFQHIRRELRAFVGVAFEQLAQQWVVRQARSGKLPFTPEAVGAHWSRRVQVDVVAVSWDSHDVLMGECKWGTGKVSRQVVRDLVEQKAVHLRQDLQGEEWSFHYALFTRAGLTDAAAAELQAHGGMAIGLQELDEGLGKR